MATFESIAELGGINATGIPVPEAVVLGLNAGKRVPIVVTINGHSYRSTVAPYRGAYMIALSAENRAAAGVEPNDPITVTIEVDTEPRVVEVPDDLQAAIDAAGVGAAWAKLSYSHQRQHVLAVDAAKAADTRARRVDAVITALR